MAREKSSSPMTSASKVIPFTTHRWHRMRRRRIAVIGTAIPIAVVGIDAGWHLVLAAPLWWWKLVLGLIWVMFFGIVAWVYGILLDQDRRQDLVLRSPDVRSV